ncbi:hypothetical protein DL95DRAFT_386966 [Leptodontidium sp. 2 PMI_412]|nr:hypothetical protein DL95DRAFT_386966 [Leptodontidium sp. 2 PMI_412]
MAAPFSSSSRTTSTCPSVKAQCSGVSLSLLATLIAAPFSSSSWTISMCPAAEA